MTVNQPESEISGVPHFGVCPQCGAADGPYNVQRVHWMVCHRHHVKWWFGTNLLSHWRREEPAIWQENATMLARFREVEPHYPDDDAHVPQSRPEDWSL